VRCVKINDLETFLAFTNSRILRCVYGVNVFCTLSPWEVENKEGVNVLPLSRRLSKGHFTLWPRALTMRWEGP
jgi:hypothetical protein